MYCIAVQRVIKDVLDLFFPSFSVGTALFKKKIQVVLALACSNLSFGGGLYYCYLSDFNRCLSCTDKDCSSVQEVVL